MRIGYIRVSSKEQNTIRQELLMNELQVEKIYIDKVSGKNTNRPELNAMMEFAREGDSIIVESISRFARNTKDLLELVEQLEKKKVEFISKKEAIDTTTPAGKFMLTVFGAVAQLERDYIKDRQKEGIAAAKLEGKQLGRPSVEYPDNWSDVYNQWKANDITAVKAMELMNLKKNSFYNLVKRYEK